MSLAHSRILALWEKADEVALVKGTDYTKGSSDRGANFRTSAADAGITALQAWLVFIGKHHAAVISYVQSGGKSESEPILMRFVDLANYIRLGWLLASQDARLYEVWDEALACYDFKRIDELRYGGQFSLGLDESLRALKESAEDSQATELQSWMAAYVLQYKQISNTVKGAHLRPSQDLVLADFSRLLWLVELGWALVSEKYSKE